MTISFEQVVDLLGKQPDEPSVHKLLGQLESTSEGEMLGKTAWSRAHGLRLDLHPRTNEISTVFIYCRLPESWQAHAPMAPFRARLLLGIECQDDRKTVGAKVGHLEAKRTYREKQPRKAPPDSDAEIQGLVKYRLDGVLDKEVKALLTYWHDRDAEPDNWFADVYDIDQYEVHFCFLVEDERLIGIKVKR